MIKLKSFSIDKYKCYNSAQTLSIDPAVTVLVGVNESGKTALLEGLAKTNYFEDDDHFKFNSVYDYPRKEKKQFDKSGLDPIVVTCVYEIDSEYIKQINDALGVNVFDCHEISYSKTYKNEGKFSGITINAKDFWKAVLEREEATNSTVADQIVNISSIDDFSKIQLTAEQQLEKTILESNKKFFQNTWKWENPIEEYVTRLWIKPRLPKFLYYSEYYSLPSSIDLRRLNDKLNEEGQKTAKALFDLADINLKQIIESTDYEAFIAELEATSNLITKSMFQYWKTNQSLRIRFDIDKRLENNQIFPVLNIRIENQKHSITLPLASRSKGFNWFFSFIVWFSKIQEDKKSEYILLLDEPGINLHAAAQADLLKFIEDLSTTYQIIYTTHSPFMIDSDKLNRVRTIYETEEGTKLSHEIFDKDSNTLFPLQAALGYDIAQNLFVSKNNLIVEGPADLIYLTHLSSILEANGKVGLRKDITIVPVGGADKVVTFVALLKANKLNLVCLLDTFKDSKGKQKIDDLIKHKIIRDRNVLYFHDFVKPKNGIADIEDLFSVDDYSKLFKESFPEHKFDSKSLTEGDGNIINQICKSLNIQSFNHYRPAMRCYEIIKSAENVSELSMDRFSKLFEKLNTLFPVT